MNKDVYNLSDIYIFELCEKKYDDEYYEDSLGLYVKNIYFTLKGYCIGYIDNNDKDIKIINALNNQELKFLNINTGDNQEFIFYSVYRRLDYYVKSGAKGIEVSKDVLLTLWDIIEKDICLENKNTFNKLLTVAIPNTDLGYYPKKNTMYYGNDYEDYYDEYEEYKKVKLQIPKGNNINILM